MVGPKSRRGASSVHLTGKQPKCRAARKRVKTTKQKVRVTMRVTNDVNDGFDIGGFKTNRVCEFEVDIKNYDMALLILKRKCQMFCAKLRVTNPCARLIKIASACWP